MVGCSVTHPRCSKKVVFLNPFTPKFGHFPSTGQKWNCLEKVHVCYRKKENVRWVHSRICSSRSLVRWLSIFQGNLCSESWWRKAWNLYRLFLALNRSEIGQAFSKALALALPAQIAKNLSIEWTFRKCSNSGPNKSSGNSDMWVCSLDFINFSATPRTHLFHEFADLGSKLSATDHGNVSSITVLPARAPTPTLTCKLPLKLLCPVFFSSSKSRPDSAHQDPGRKTGPSSPTKYEPFLYKPSKHNDSQRPEVSTSRLEQLQESAAQHWAQPTRGDNQVEDTGQWNKSWMLKRKDSYCWWKISCTSWYSKYPIIYSLFQYSRRCRMSSISSMNAFWTNVWQSLQ